MKFLTSTILTHLHIFTPILWYLKYFTNKTVQKYLNISFPVCVEIELSSLKELHRAAQRGINYIFPSTKDIRFDFIVHPACHLRSQSFSYYSTPKRSYIKKNIYIHPKIANNNLCHPKSCFSPNRRPLQVCIFCFYRVGCDTKTNMARVERAMFFTSSGVVQPQTWHNHPLFSPKFPTPPQLCRVTKRANFTPLCGIEAARFELTQILKPMRQLEGSLICLRSLIHWLFSFN